MAKEVICVSEEGMTSTNAVRDFEVTIDATGKTAPDTLESLLAAYASCYVPALRVGGEQRGIEDLGHVEIDAHGELNDDDKLEAVRFDVRVEADPDDETMERAVHRANDLCKVHDAMKGSLHPDVAVKTDAF
ncbi:hypothetical protein BRD17_00400 [Halobacteriales archaeon SW_7_68_16]|nr:MAG: hypothetical protein BRD17_00400 [Halobacteriales archaeon SW_7_68_16]